MFRIFAPTEILPLDVRTSFSQGVFYPKILEIENMVDVSKLLGILILAISINLELPFSQGRELILRRSVHQRKQQPGNHVQKSGFGHA